MIDNIRYSFHRYTAYKRHCDPLSRLDWDVLVCEWCWKAAYSFILHRSLDDLMIFIANIGMWLGWLFDNWLACKPIKLLEE